MSEPKDDNLDIFGQPDHEKRAKEFMEGIKEIAKDYPDVRANVFNATMSLADLYEKAAKDNPDLEKDFRQKANELDVKSADQTSVLVSLSGDALPQITSMKRAIAFLSDEYKGKDEDKSRVIDLWIDPVAKRTGMRYAYHTHYVFPAEED